MTVEELRAVKAELKQLNAELKKFKKDLLTARTEELGRIVPAADGKHLRQKWQTL